MPQRSARFFHALTIAAAMAWAPAAEAQKRPSGDGSPSVAQRNFAVAQLERLRTTAQRSGDLKGEANALTLLGLFALDDEPKSRDRFEQAGDLYARLGDPLSLAVISLSLGFSAKESHDDVRAEELLRRAATLAAALPRPFEHVFCEPLDGVESLLLAGYQAARISWKPSERIERIPAVIEGLARGTLAEILVRRGRFPEAEAEVKRILDLSSVLDGALAAKSREFLAFIESNKEDPKRQAVTLLEAMRLRGIPQGSPAAEDLFQRAKELLVLPAEPEDRAKTLAVVSLLARNANRPEEAVALLAEAERLMPSLPPFVEGLRSILFSDLEASDRGRRAAESAATLATGDDEARLAEALKWLAIAQADESGPVETSKALRKLVELTLGVSPEVRTLAEALTVLEGEPGSVDGVKLKNFAAALADLLPAEGMESSRRLLNAIRDDPAANLDTLATNALQEIANLPVGSMAENDPDRSVILMLRASLLRNQGRSAEAIAVARELAESKEQMQTHLRLDEFSLNVAREAAKSFDPLVEMEIAAGRPEDAFESAERARASTLLRWLGGPGADPRANADPALLARLDELQACVKKLEPAQDRESDAEVLALRGEIDDLLLRLKLLQPAYTELPENRIATVAQIRAVLPEDTTLVSFFTLPQKTVAWIVDRAGVRSVELAPSRSRLSEEVRRYRSAIAAEGYPAGDPGRSPTRGIEVVDSGLPGAGPIGQDLYRSLIAPLVPYLHSSRLVLVPHGALQQLPWAALQEPETGRYLAQAYTLSLVPAAGALVAGSKPLEPRSDGPIRALVLGDPETAIPGLPPLPAARREAESVARILGTKAEIGKQARESTLRGAAASLSLLHLAAHGEQDAKEPRASFLALAPDAEQDGRLKMGEIFDELRLPKRPLVVLSACQSALGRRSGGDEIEGMIRAFLYAGAGAVVATLWSIDDEASELLIESFYKNLVAGQSAAEALRGAQRMMIAHPKYGAPYYWAGYVLTGDWQSKGMEDARPKVSSRRHL